MEEIGYAPTSHRTCELFIDTSSTSLTGATTSLSLDHSSFTSATGTNSNIIVPSAETSNTVNIGIRTYHAVAGTCSTVDY